MTKAESAHLPHNFIHLKVHSSYSLAEGAIKLSDLLSHCQDEFIPAVAVTDTSNVFGAMDFCLSAVKCGLQSIIGAKILVKSPFKPKRVSLGTEIRPVFHELVLLAKSELGYKNLIKLISRAFLLHPDHHLPYVIFDQLEELSLDLICLTGGIKGGVADYLLKKETANSKTYFEKLKSFYGDNLYMEVHRFGIPGEVETEDDLVQMAYDQGVPLVATNEAFFIHKDQYTAHDALSCIAQGSYVYDPERPRLTPNHRFKSVSEMVELFKDLPEAIENTVRIAKRCHFVLEPLPPALPPFKTERGENEELRIQGEKGLDYRLERQVYGQNMTDAEKGGIRKTYFDRLKFEIDIIHRMGYSGYYLIVAEFIKWAKDQSIPVGPGRGSGAGSLVAWALTITDVDPIELNLLFERFLNPERISMPDFDIDFCQDRRDEVIQHVCDEYGADKVAQIITFGKLQAKAVIRDTGRVLGMPYGQVDRISKLIPTNPASPVTLTEALEQVPELHDEINGDEKTKELFNIALQLEGLYRHASTHAAGVVIAGEPLENIVALYKDENSALPATQFNMKFVELCSLVKFDFLGLKTLSVMQGAVDLVKEHQNIEIIMPEIPLDDKNTFDLLQSVETVGVFQLESTGMREVIRKLKPTQFEEVIALVALYRPGPMDDIPRYVACRHGEQEITYLHPMLEPILKETYGVMVYQEQVMQIAQQLAGYSLGQADLLRRAMGKKIKAEMDMQRDIFTEGCLKHNKIPGTTANRIFDAMAKFASYGFNKCHSAPYGLIAYQTAYLKANYPVEFTASTMNYDLQNTDKLCIGREELIRMKIPLLMPDVNKSFAKFTVEKCDLSDSMRKKGTSEFGVRYALAALKNVGESAIRLMVKEREENGLYTGLIDFTRRLDSKAVNKRMLENLISSGAFDSIESNRAKLFANIDSAIKNVGEKAAQLASDQQSLFGGGGAESVSLPEVSLIEARAWGRAEKAQHEFDAIGFYLSEHPVDAYQDMLKKYNVKSYTELSQTDFGAGEIAVNMAGVVVSKKERISKKGNKFAFVQFSDASGMFEGVLFAEAFTNGKALIEPGTAVLIKATAKREEGDLRFVIQDLSKLEDSVAATSKELTFTIKSHEIIDELYEALNASGRGSACVEITLVCDRFESIVKLRDSYKVTPKTIDDLSRIPHLKNIIVA